jgi:hypothetical protein
MPQGIAPHSSSSSANFFKKRAAQIVTTSASVVAGLAWNEAFQVTFKEIPDLRIAGPWVYAPCVTFLALLLAYLMRNYLE